MKTYLLLCTAIAVFFCGRVSAEDPMYVHVPWDCKWTDDPPCIVIPVSNSNKLNDQISPTYKISKAEMQKYNLIDLPSVMNFVQGADIAQSGPTGQQASIFVRGTNSNHTLVLLNGIPINDASTPTGAHDFGQDFMFNVHQIEVYKGSAGAHYGADAIGGAVNFVTTVDYQKKIGADANTITGNYYWNTSNDWDISVSGGMHESETQSALAGADETDGVKNKTLGINVSKWLDYNLNFTSSLFTRNTLTEIDGHSLSIQQDKWSDNSFYAFQTGLTSYNTYGTSSLVMHTHEYDRKYDDADYSSNSVAIKGEHKKDNWGFGFDWKHDISSANSLWDTSDTNWHNLGFFANYSYDIFSYHYRIDEEYDSYKIGFLQPITDNFTLRGNHSTGYKNSTRYTDVEHSNTQELSFDYKQFTTTLFQSDIGDLNTQGIELGYIKDNFRFFASHLDSKVGSTQQLRRPNLSVGFLHSVDLEEDMTLNTNYKYKGNHLDVHNSNWSTISMPEVHLLDVGITKHWNGIGFSAMFNNVLDYNYESPHGFSQEGRTFNLSLSTNF